MLSREDGEEDEERVRPSRPFILARPLSVSSSSHNSQIDGARTSRACSTSLGEHCSEMACGTTKNRAHFMVCSWKKSKFRW